MGKSQGAQSRNVRNKSEATREKPRTLKTPPGRAAHFGMQFGDHSTDRRQASTNAGPVTSVAPGFQPVPFGNQLATNVGAGGPGAGRTVYPRGLCYDSKVTIKR
jgi:hypothetical protein